MRFKEWVRLDEIQHISLGKPTIIMGVTADSIDFRFEDWGRGYNPDKPRKVAKLPPSKGEQFFNGSFSAPIGNGEYLNVVYSREDVPITQGSLALAVEPDRKLFISTEKAAQSLPAQWFDFAVFYLGNKVSKPPEWPRSDFERGHLANLE